MKPLELQPMTTWAEDRATQRCDPSADPGAKTGVGIELHRSVPLPFHPLRDWHESDKPSRLEAAFHRQDAHPLANTKRSGFQFSLNQDKFSF